MNCVQLTGRLTKAPNIKTVKTDRKVANFTIAVTDKLLDSIDFIDVTVWGVKAESVEKYLKKGSKINVVGKLKQEKYQDQITGNTKYKLYVLATEIDYLSDTKEEIKDEEFLKKLT